MAWTLVQKTAAVATGTGGTVTGTLPAGSTAGNLLVSCLSGNTGNTQFTGPSGWVQAAQVANTGVSRAEVWYLPPALNTGGVSSFAFAAGTGGLRCEMAEFHTSVTTPMVTLATSGTGTAGATTTCTATAGSTAGDLVVCSFFEHLAAASAVTWTDPSGFTLLAALTASGQNQAYTAYDLSAAGGTLNITATSNVFAASSGWTGAVATFNAVTGGAGLSVTTSSLPDGKIGVAYGQTLTATGGTQPYSWAISAGALPAGLSLTSSGGRGGGFGATLFMTQPPVPMETATANWSALIGRPVTCRKVYYQTGQFPTTPDVNVQGCIDLGMTAYLCYKPAWNPPTTADYNHLQASLQAFSNAGLTAKVILFQEIEDQALSPAQYKAMHQFYEPAVHAVYPSGLCHDSAGSKHLLWASFFPTTLGIGSLIDEYGIDYYATVYHGGVHLDAYVALTAATGKPFGVMEMGVSVGTEIPPPNTGPGSVTEYFHHVTAVAAANPPGSYMWYTQDNKNVHNIISDPADYRIPLLQALSDTVTGTSAAGQIAGTPTAAGLASFTARVTDANSATATAALTINVAASSLPVITTLTLPAATAGVAYSQQVVATGGTAPLTFTLTLGALPDGLALGHAGFIFGTPTTSAASSGFTVTATDANNQADTQALFITVVASAPSPSPAPNAFGFPQVIIEAGLSPAAPQVPPGTFLLDDPVYGKLDSGNQLGDSTTWTDIAAFFRSGTITRTSTRVQGPLVTYQAGAASAVLKNADGRFDPANPASPYAGNLRPMLPFRVRAVYGSVSYSLWSGFTDSWGTTGTNWGPNYSETTVTGTDGFKVLAGITLPAIPLGSDGVGDGDGEDTGARVTRILNAAGWFTDHRRVDVGDSTVQGTLYGTDALSLLQLTADSEIGTLYIDGAGFLVYRHRQAIILDTRSTQVQAIFGDLPGTAHGALTELPYTSLERADDDTQLANDIQATSAGGTLQEAENLSSERKYLFPRTYARTDLILEDDPTTLNWAQWVLSVSLEGDDRFDVLTVTPRRDPGLWAQVLGREIGDRIQVWRRPPGVAAITKDVFIRGITHTVDVSTRTWSTVWDLQSAQRYTGFMILDDPANGLLNTGKLAF